MPPELLPKYNLSQSDNKVWKKYHLAENMEEVKFQENQRYCSTFHLARHAHQ